jgi:hypothetical protein
LVGPQVSISFDFEPEGWSSIDVDDIWTIVARSLAAMGEGSDTKASVSSDIFAA